jgi:hypothetical protein
VMSFIVRDIADRGFGNAKRIGPESKTNKCEMTGELNTFFFKE